MELRNKQIINRILTTPLEIGITNINTINHKDKIQIIKIYRDIIIKMVNFEIILNNLPLSDHIQTSRLKLIIGSFIIIIIKDFIDLTSKEISINQITN